MTDWSKQILWGIVIIAIIAGRFALKVNQGAARREAHNQQQSAVDLNQIRSNPKPYLERRADFRTKLTKTGKSPQEWENDPVPQGIEKVKYPSGGFQLDAGLYIPPGQKGRKNPALVFFHGGFANSNDEILCCTPFMRAGYVVMAPTLRAENGGPGNFELFLGEVDDAANAVRWLSQQSYVDSDHIYTFGHSVGGGISALLSLMDNVPIKHGGSSGGLYPSIVFEAWKTDGVTPFNPKIAAEREMRLLIGNIRWMKRLHYAYIGDTDDGFKLATVPAEAEMRNENIDKKLFIKTIPGDHFTSFDPALRAYLSVIQKESRFSPADRPGLPSRSDEHVLANENTFFNETPATPPEKPLEVTQEKKEEKRDQETVVNRTQATTNGSFFDMVAPERHSPSKTEAKPSSGNPFETASSQPSSDNPFETASSQPSSDNPFGTASSQPSSDNPFGTRSEKTPSAPTKVKNTDVNPFATPKTTQTTVKKRVAPEGGIIDLVPDRKYLVGFEITTAKDSQQQEYIASLTPIYADADGKEIVTGQVFGVPKGKPRRMIAPTGYAVGTMTVITNYRLTGIDMTTMKIGSGGTLDTKDVKKISGYGAASTGKKRFFQSQGDPIQEITAIVSGDAIQNLRVAE